MEFLHAVLLVVVVNGAIAQQDPGGAPPTEPPAVLLYPGDYIASENDALAMTCAATGVPIPTITWFKVTGGSDIRVQSTDTNSPHVEEMNINGTDYNVSTMVLCSVGLSDAGQYKCSAANVVTGAGVASPVATFTISVNTSSVANIQLQLIGVTDCSDWKSADREAKIHGVTENILDQIPDSLCGTGCEVEITDQGFYCINSDANIVTFRARLTHYLVSTGGEMADTADIIAHLDDWENGGPSITVEFEGLKVDPSCNVEIEDFSDPACSPTAETSDSGSDSQITVIGAAIGGVIGGIILTVGIVLALVACWFHHRKGKHDLRAGTTGDSDYVHMSGTTDKLKAGSISFGPNAAYGQYTIGVRTDANAAYEQHTIDQPVPEAPLYEHLK